MNALNSPTVRRNARGRLLPGARLNPGGRPVSGVTEIRARFSQRLPEIFGRLMEMAMDNSQPPLAQLAAIRLVLDYLLGRPQVTVEATSVNVNIAELYRAAMIRANAGRGASEINGTAGEKEIQ